MWPEMFLLLFVFFTIAHLTGEAFKNARGHYLTKPALMPLLASYYMAAATIVLYDDRLSGRTVPAGPGIPAFFRTPYSLLFSIYPQISEMPSVIRGPIRKRGSPM